MDSNLRTIVKAVTWQALGLATTSLLAWFYTGSVLGALGFALSTSATGLAFFVVHERIWARVHWGLRNARTD
ncbi:DUF2061 domain-containing protein [Hoeflea sp.]|uniref:DUF2061 domain-containing protein n=1 Tax=Hoeflea sp. TaxID=1940281 RepID=UPI0019B8A684|nr:DUF2061 domain-containing protein [Hoeflea sp.]MBC7280834.1 DUF2061 domain-containing protein [Hoeflea sp.]